MKHIAHHAIHLARSLRSRRIITKWKLLAVLLSCNSIFLLLIFIHSFSLPGTYVGDTFVGLKTHNQVKNIVIDLYKKPIQINMQNHMYEYTYDRLGVYMDPEKATAVVFAKNNQSVPKKVAAFFTGIFRKTAITIPLSFSQEYYTFIKKTEFTSGDEESIVHIDQNQKNISLFEGTKKYMLQSAAFQDRLIQHFGKNEEQLVAPLAQIPSTIEHQIQNANTAMQTVYSAPLTVVLRANDSDHFLTLTTDELITYTTASVNQDTGTVTLAVDRTRLEQSLPLLVTNHTKSNDKKIADAIDQALASRIAGDHVESVRITLDSGPNTDGSIANAYIEVDISQQKMFTFKDGRLSKTYRVSTGKDYPTPTGTFTILNKATIGYSKIYDVWMPFWMAFSYSNELHAYFGIHELPYFYRGTDKIQRPRDFIGTPNTGGCVALDIGDAKEVYQFASVGMPVVVNL